MAEDAEIHLRRVRYFLAVVRHRSFARASTELRVAQPALSRAVKALEDDLGVALLERGHGRFAVTGAGETLIEEGTALLAQAEALRRTVRAAAGRRELTVGFQPGLILTEVIQRFAVEHPTVGVIIRQLECSVDLAAEFASGVDVAVVRSVVVPDDVPVVPLFDDPEHLALPAAHPLAARRSLTLADLEGEPILRQAGPGVPVGDLSVTGIVEGLEVVALGRAVARVPASAAAYYRRPGVVYRPVVDAAPFPVVLAMRAAADSDDALLAFIDAVQRHYSHGLPYELVGAAMP